MTVNTPWNLRMWLQLPDASSPRLFSRSPVELLEIVTLLHHPLLNLIARTPSPSSTSNHTPAHIPLPTSADYPVDLMRLELSLLCSGVAPIAAIRVRNSQSVAAQPPNHRSGTQFEVLPQFTHTRLSFSLIPNPCVRLLRINFCDLLER